ncbi:hypothetical protein GCM10027176_10940 [Actinoallomurus bryophytorum]|uniref:WD40 repeat protein n=1 Tax=Actinoallomurus bryophytorum TaxID=1490222 RepID=A0A543CQ25_9ACTN|nr:hypothetical protein [Actinoallomurus bryophytorum]TQL99204.1 hypothetical protein FB559_4861 [Actinoallomurus bryophytorum]
MTTEDRLRSALTAVAELVQPEEESEQRTAAVRSRRRVRRYGPLAVAVAILLIVVAGVVARRDRAPAPDTLGGGSARYFIANVSGGDHIHELTVRDVQTGKVTATREPPAGGEWTRLSATADPNVFYVVLEHQDLASLYRLRIDRSGRIGALTRVRDLPSSGVEASFLAVSPDGTRVAFPVRRDDRPDGPARIDVMTLSNGRRTAFRTSEAGGVGDLSWAADGRHLAFVLRASAAHPSIIRILDTDAGHDLVADSHLVLVDTAVHTYTTPVLSADGQSLYLIADHRAGGHRSTQVLEVDARTGRPVRMLYEQPFRSGGNFIWVFTTLTRDPSGTALLLVDDLRRSAHRIDIASRRVTTIPFPRGMPNLIAW